AEADDGDPEAEPRPELAGGPHLHHVEERHDEQQANRQRDQRRVHRMPEELHFRFHTHGRKQAPRRGTIGKCPTWTWSGRTMCRASARWPSAPGTPSAIRPSTARWSCAWT